MINRGGQSTRLHRSAPTQTFQRRWLLCSPPKTQNASLAKDLCSSVDDSTTAFIVGHVCCCSHRGSCSLITHAGRLAREGETVRGHWLLGVRRRNCAPASLPNCGQLVPSDHGRWPLLPLPLSRFVLPSFHALLELRGLRARSPHRSSRFPMGATTGFIHCGYAISLPPWLPCRTHLPPSAAPLAVTCASLSSHCLHRTSSPPNEARNVCTPAERWLAVTPEP